MIFKFYIFEDINIVIITNRYGGAEAATYCILNTLMKHLTYDSHADIYMYSKLYHNRRPGIWTDVSDYLRLHVALQAACQASPAPPQLQLNGAPPALPVNGSANHDTVRMPPEGMEAAQLNHNVA